MDQTLKNAAMMLLAATPAALASHIFCEDHTYAGKDSTALDEWCQATCNQFTGSYPGFCPDHLCKCVNGEPSTNYPTDPRQCPGDVFMANPGTTASDEWCQSTCTAEPTPVCPSSMCLCGNPCEPGESLLELNFDDIPTNPFAFISGPYQGFDWTNTYALNPNPPYPDSGYKNGVVSEPNVAFNGFADEMSLAPSSGGGFRMVGGTFTAAWQLGVGLTVRGTSGGSDVWTRGTNISTTTTVVQSFPRDQVDTVFISTTPGTEDPAFPNGSGAHAAIDNLFVCVAEQAQAQARAQQQPQQAAFDPVDVNAAENPASEGSARAGPGGSGIPRRGER